jgi:hypothetical protein
MDVRTPQATDRGPSPTPRRESAGHARSSEMARPAVTLVRSRSSSPAIGAEDSKDVDALP